MTFIGEREVLLTRVLAFFILLFIVAVFFSFSATLICSDDIVINTFIKFLYGVVSDGGVSRTYKMEVDETRLEFNGSSELRTQLLIENCSKNSLRR